MLLVNTRQKHTKHTGKAQFSQTPRGDPCQRAMYHYIAWGRTLEPHMYRNNNDPVSEPDIAAYIAENLEKSSNNQQDMQDPSMNKAMMAFTKTLNKSLNCTPATVQKQMHEFGKGTVATNRTKHGGVISVNPPAHSRRTFKVPGRGPAPLGRPPNQSIGRTQLVVSKEDEYFARSDTKTKQVPKKANNFSGIVAKNETLPK